AAGLPSPHGAICGSTVGTATVIAMTFPICMKLATARTRGPSLGPELKRIATEEGVLELSIFETGVPPRFRLSGVTADTVRVQTCREGGERQDFRLVNRGTYWESVQQIPEPHQFAVSVIINHAGHARRYETQFTEHDHGHHEYGYNHAHGRGH